MPQDQRLSVWRAVTGHVLALMLTVGFFAIVFFALLGYVHLSDPTTAQFVGTVTGYAISKLERPLAYYFYLPPTPRKKSGVDKEEQEQEPEKEKQGQLFSVDEK